VSDADQLEQSTEGAEVPPDAPTIDSLLGEVQRLTASFATYQSKTNKELAGLRRKTKAGQVPAEIQQPSTDSRDAAGGVSEEVVQAYVALGELRGRLDPDQLESLSDLLEGRSAIDQRAILEGVSRANGKKLGSKPGRDVRTSTRGAPPAPRDSDPRPRTLAEYVALAKSNPDKKARLDADPEFDPAALPRNDRALGR
jgi:hypothetical protein